MAIVAREEGPDETRRQSPLLGLKRSFTGGPVAIPCLIAIVVFGIWAAGEAGQPTTDWYPGALAILALLVLAASALPLRIAEIPTTTKVAVGFLAAFTAWSFLSITWADSNGDAWDGANRTLLYLLVFVLFAAWPQRGRAATTVIALWIGALTVVAVVILVRTQGAAGIDQFRGGRLSEPAGYANATAALFAMPAFAALVLSSRFELPPVLRGLLGAAAVMLASVGALAISRGSIYSMPIMLILLFAVVPGRARLFATAVPITLGVGAVMPTILDVNDALSRSQPDVGSLSRLVPLLFVIPVIVGLVVAAGAFFEDRVSTPPRRDLARRGFGALGIAVLVIGVVGAIVVAGNPVSRLGDAWDSFKQGYPEQADSRLSRGLGSNRYDFYRVSLNEFADHPFAGIGADNFQEQYLRGRRNAQETPRYPHSLEMRTLAQTGVVGALLLLGFVGAAAMGAGLAIKRGPPLAGGVAAAGLLVFAYWLVHGSFDWFWEFAGLGAPAFAMVGLACGLIPRAASPVERRTRSPLITAGLVVAAAVFVFSLTLPWLSDVQVDYAAKNWRSNPDGAYDRLDRAASLNPLSADPYLVQGTIAVARSEEGRARTSFGKALDRDPRNSYALLEAGALATIYGDFREATRLLGQASSEDPRSELKRKTLDQARARKPVDIGALNAALQGSAAQLR